PGWYEKAPLVGVLYHQLGSLLVLLNSMRLLAFERTSTSSTVARIRTSAAAVGRWFDSRSTDDVLHGLAHRWKPIAAAAAIVVILAWLGTALAQIEAGEVGIVQRFGAVTIDLEPGLHLRWPWPVETVTRIRPGAIRTVEVGFRTLAEEPRERSFAGERLRRPAGGADAGLTWSSPHAEGVARLTDEAVMITGDGDLVEV